MIEKATHFKIVRVASSILIHLIPEEWINDYHLDSYCLKLYKNNKETGDIMWIGTNKRGFKENNTYLISKMKALDKEIKDNS